MSQCYLNDLHSSIHVDRLDSFGHTNDLPKKNKTLVLLMSRMYVKVVSKTGSQ